MGARTLERDDDVVGLRMPREVGPDVRARGDDPQPAPAGLAEREPDERRPDPPAFEGRQGTFGV